MHVLKFIITYTKPYRGYLLGQALATCFIACCSPLQTFLVKQLVDTVAGVAHHNLWLLCAVFLVLEWCLPGVWAFADYCIIRFTSRFRLDTVLVFMERLYLYSHTFFQNHPAGSLTAKLGDAFQTTPKLVGTFIVEFILLIIRITMSIIFLASTNIFFAIAMVMWVGIFFLATFLSMKKANILIKDYSEEKTTLLGRAADYITNVMNVRLFASKDLEIERFNQLKGSFISKGERSGFYLTGYYIVQGIFSSIYITILLIVLIQKHESSQISPGDFAFVVMINFEIINMLFRTSHVFRDYVMDWGTVDQALAILDHIPEVLDKADAKPLKITQGSIIFEEVAFSYKDTAPLFCNKSITILPGQKVGLVGYSGGGKSTFVNLILRLYDVKEGRILIDAQDIRGCTQDSLRLNVAMIPQDPSLFHRTIMENIRYGRSEASDEEVTEAAKRAHAHEFIINLPDGYNSLVGERGVKLSGGQRQRVAIARAILKNAPILMLDEATSQLDSVTEGHIQESLRELMHGKTTLVIAHRLSTLLNMDRILVFDKGKIIEDGTHTELLNNNWLYKTLWDTQIGGFLLDKRDDDNTTS